jgi:P27 family predicted phage terminase small subunit
MKGRKATPIEQRKREGNPGHRPLPEPLKFKSGPPTKPKDLPAAASELWDELVPVMVAAGIADQVHRATLVALCVQWARGEMARRVIAEEGYFARGSMGQVIEHPALGMEARAHQLLLRFCEQYGLTAASAARIAAVTSPDAAADEDEMASVTDLTPRLKKV